MMIQFGSFFPHFFFVFFSQSTTDQSIFGVQIHCNKPSCKKQTRMRTVQKYKQRHHCEKSKEHRHTPYLVFSWPNLNPAIATNGPSNGRPNPGQLRARATRHCRHRPTTTERTFGSGACRRTVRRTATSVPARRATVLACGGWRGPGGQTKESDKVGKEIRKRNRKRG